MKYALKALKFLVLGALGLFALTFTVYYFDLDSKGVSKLMPLMTKWYDYSEKKRERKL